MRQLGIVGVDAESSVIDCEVIDSGERFTLAIDDRLRAAARGEFLGSPSSSPRSGVTGTMRPREIQERIRHGADPAAVAAEAGVALSRIEGFARPVLLERSTAARLARGSHPMLADGPTLDTLGERVDAALEGRGIAPDLIGWDAWKAKDGSWVVTTSWPAGLSDDATATWSFVPDSHGGSARALDEEAEGILDPRRALRLRTVPPRPAPPVRAVPVASSSPVDSPEAPGAQPAVGSLTPLVSARTAPAPLTMTPPRPKAGARPETAQDSPPNTHSTGDDAADRADEDFLQHPPTEPAPKSPRRHPTVPSWEDVLLGVRGKEE